MVLRIWLFFSAMLLLVGAAVRFDLITDERLGPLAADPEVAAGDTAAFASSNPDLELLPMVRYAGTEVALVRARAIPENRSGAPIIVVELAVRNTANVQVRMPVSMFDLIGPDAVVAPADRFEFTDHGDRLVIEPGRTEPGSVVFKLRPRSSLELDRYVLQIGEQGRWPVHLPLDGMVPPAVYPQPLEADTGERARFRGLTVELTQAATALEYGVYRAAIGQHLAVMTVTVSGSPTSSFAIERGLWTLVDGDGTADGGTERRAIAAVPGLRAPESDEVTMELIFAYSTESSDLTLLVGPSDQRQLVARFGVQAFE